MTWARPGATCPGCDRGIESATEVMLGDRAPRVSATEVMLGDRAPRVGDASICWYCGAVLVFTADGFRWATFSELEQLNRDPRFRLARAVVLDKLAAGD